jgi:O-antigen ligase
VNVVYLIFLGLAWLVIECLVGGTRLLYCLPGYALLSIGALLSIASFRSKRIPPDSLCLGSTLLLGAWILLRSWYSPVAYLAWPDFFMMIACLMAYLTTALYLTGAGVQMGLIGVLWAIASLELWVGALQFVKDPHFMLFGLVRPTLQRPSGLYISPNTFAGLLAAVAILSISMGVWSRWPSWAKMLSFYFAACCLAGVGISGSRGGYFDVIGSLICFAIVSIHTVRTADPRRFVPVLIGAVAGVLLVLGLAAFLLSHSAFLTKRMDTMVYKDVRIYNWEAALDHIRVSPLVGTGSGTHQIYGRLFRRPEIQADPIHAHCDYLELLAEYGIAGAVCMILFLAAHLWLGFRALSEITHKRFAPSGLLQSNRFAIQVGALCAVAGLGIHSVFDFDLHVPGNALIFAFIFGILANPDIERQPGVLSRGLVPFAKVLLPALGVFMLWRGLPLLPSEYCSEIARTSLRTHEAMEAVKYAALGIGPAGAPLAGQTGSAATRGAAAAGDPPPWLVALVSKTGGEPRNPELFFYAGEANRLMGSLMRNFYLRRGYLERADAAYKQGLVLFPQDESMLVRDGQALDGLKRFDDAEVEYTKAISVDPRLGILHQYYEAHLAAEGRKADADEENRKWSLNVPAPVDKDQAPSAALQ